MRYFVLRDGGFFFPLFCLCRFIFAVNHDENIVRESFAVKIRYPSIPYVFCERFYSMWFYVGFFPSQFDVVNITRILTGHIYPSNI